MDIEGIEYKLSETHATGKMIELKKDLEPRHQCANYIRDNGGTATLVTKIDFDQNYTDNKFSNGPNRDSFGDGPGEPYMPNRQAFGTLESGQVIYCELSDDHQRKTKEFFELSGVQLDDS